MSNTYLRVYDRLYAVDRERKIFHRDSWTSATATPLGPSDCGAAEFLLTCHYRRPGMTEEQSRCADMLALGEEPDDADAAVDINVAITAVRIIKERAFLTSVVRGDQEALAKIDRDERIGTKMAEVFGGHAIGSSIVVTGTGSSSSNNSGTSVA